MLDFHDPSTVLSIVAVLFLAIGLHEYAHCKMADIAGDPTPAFYGRVTLNLTKHFELMGVIFMVLSAMAGYGIGWGKPAPMNPAKMKNPRWDFFAAVIAGPLSNVAQAVIFALLTRLLRVEPPNPLRPDFFQLFFFFGVIINLRLAIFNLIPIGPLDGQWLLGLLMPEKARHYWFKFNRGIGFAGFFVLMIVLQMVAKNGGPNLIDMILGKPVFAAYLFLTGQHG